MSIFNKLSDNYTSLSESDRVALFKSTAVEPPAVTDLQTISKFKVIIYKEK